MERSEILTAMGDLKLYGMKAAFDEIIGTAVKRQHQPQRIIGDLLTAEIADAESGATRTAIPRQGGQQSGEGGQQVTAA